jgi:hypothetical protein
LEPISGEDEAAVRIDSASIRKRQRAEQEQRRWTRHAIILVHRFVCDRYGAGGDCAIRYWKTTLFVILRVEQDQQGYWSAYRDNYPLLRDGKPARFTTSGEAQRAADAHELDLFPNAKVIDDGLSWLPDPEIDWRSVPHLVEERANSQRSASSLLP